ncbi:hypothetical protein NQ314_015577 [Rhamnusium bicolor]|uniref:Uncharacterized protein n=1 Tax=Rhamnusium bicolor TaxID=1586634 RepID=A0AAV8WYE6_9CUCU|nr:hypothetical protein NQ314_015577 [Rhamnusium bicolor]
MPADRKTSVFEKISKIGWTYTPPKPAIREETDEKMEESRNSYFKFEDVFDDGGNFKTNDEDIGKDEFLVKGDSLNVTFKQCNDSKAPLCSSTLKKNKGRNENAETRNRRNFNFNKFKIKLDFLRVLTPKKTANRTSSYDNVESNVKYKKMRNIKSNTL